MVVVLEDNETDGPGCGTGQSGGKGLVVSHVQGAVNNAERGSRVKPILSEL